MLAVGSRQLYHPDTQGPPPWTQRCPFLPGRIGIICHHTNYTALATDIRLSDEFMLTAVSMKMSYCDNLSLS